MVFVHKCCFLKLDSFQKKQVEWLLRSYFHWRKSGAPFLGFARAQLGANNKIVRLPDIKEEVVIKVEHSLKDLALIEPLATIVLCELFQNDECLQSICKRYQISAKKASVLKSFGMAYLFKEVQMELNY